MDIHSRHSHVASPATLYRSCISHTPFHQSIGESDLTVLPLFVKEQYRLGRSCRYFKRRRRRGRRRLCWWH